MIAGFLVGQVYATKYDAGSWQPYARLAIRGAKLLLLFTLLNLGRCIALRRGLSGGLEEFASRSSAIYLSGNGRAGIFEVLLPIAYFLLLAPALLWLRSRIGASVVICAVAVCLLCEGLEMKGILLKNLDLVSVGVIGMALGLVSIQIIDRMAIKWLPVLLLYVGYLVASHFIGDSYPMQTLAGVLAVLVLYSCALQLNLFVWHGKQMILLGKYSLLGYLAQIAILQAVVKVFGGTPDSFLAVTGVILATMILTFLVVLGVQTLRTASRAGDAAYKMVFA